MAELREPAGDPRRKCGWRCLSRCGRVARIGSQANSWAGPRDRPV